MAKMMRLCLPCCICYYQNSAVNLVEPLKGLEKKPRIYTEVCKSRSGDVVGWSGVGDGASTEMGWGENKHVIWDQNWTEGQSSVTILVITMFNTLTKAI